MKTKQRELNTYEKKAIKEGYTHEIMKNVSDRARDAFHTPPYYLVAEEKKRGNTVGR